MNQNYFIGAFAWGFFVFLLLSMNANSQNETVKKASENKCTISILSVLIILAALHFMLHKAIPVE